jgi:DNA-binding CsgD family transcriptional regulator
MSEELNELVAVHRKIVALSNQYHHDKPVIDKTNIQTIQDMLNFIEHMFTNLVVLIYGPDSERLYFSDRVKSVMGYPVDGLVNMTDLQFLSGIHPDDIKPVRHCMEMVAAMYFDPNYDHSRIRYKIKLRYRKGDGAYAFIVYEAVTIFYNSVFVDLALILDNTRIAPHDRVELIIEKKVGDKFIVIKHFIPNEDTEITSREYEIINLIKKGYSNNQIADRLAISVYTVKNHKQNLFKKFNAKNSIHLMRLLEAKNAL